MGQLQWFVQEDKQTWIESKRKVQKGDSGGLLHCLNLSSRLYGPFFKLFYINIKIFMVLFYPKSASQSKRVEQERLSGFNQLAWMTHDCISCTKMIDMNQILSTKYDKRCVFLSLTLASLTDFILMVLWPSFCSWNIHVWSVDLNVSISLPDPPRCC